MCLQNPWPPCGRCCPPVVARGQTGWCPGRSSRCTQRQSAKVADPAAESGDVSGGPDDGASVGAADHEQAFADCRGAGVGCSAFTPLNITAQAAHQCLLGNPQPDCVEYLGHVRVVLGQASGQASDECPERAASLALDRFAGFVERSPVLELLHILQEEHTWARRVYPADHDPGEGADPLAARRAALGLAEVAAIGRGPQNAHGLPAGCL